MRKAVIFDLDGTLADTLESIAYCANETLKRQGFASIEKEEYRYLVGDGAAKLIERALIKSGDQSLVCFDKAMQDYAEIFEKHCMYHVKPYEGIVSTLHALRAAGVKAAVLSNKPHERTLQVIKDLFGDGLFQVVAGQRPEIERKPSPAGVFAIMKEFGVSADEVLYLGDTNTDMKTGKSAGVFTIGVLWGFRDRKELEENHADAVIENPAEIFKYIC